MAALDTALQDLRYALRALATHRAFATLSVLCLGLAIGLNTTVFTFVSALILRPVPFADVDRLVSVFETRHADPRSAGTTSYPTFLEWQAQTAGLVEMAAQHAVRLRVTGDGEPQGYAGAIASCANCSPKASLSRSRACRSGS